jgi:D-alanyl-D-alanine carboxypeptidase (penicillin-binding protein 5/6)
VPDLVAVTLSREARKQLVVKLSYLSPVPAPIQAGERVGQAEITAPGLAPLTAPLVAAGDAARAGLLARATGSLSYLIWGEPAG